ncbi:cytochrome P450 [Phaeosphaeriaceae sp. PMI808]|nr:cytochrome P450 [Phaeosphaeriaceae sp. PMI808]
MGIPTKPSALPRLSVVIGNLSVAKVVSLAIAFVVVRWVVRGIYRVYFHPLSRFPGPKFSAFTRLPYLTAIAKGELPRHVAQLHEQYGEVVRLSPDELSFTNPKAWRDIYGYGSKEGPGSAPPKNWNRQGNSPNGANSLVAEPDNAEHARIRRIFSPAFSDRALVQQSPLFTKYTNQLIGNLRESAEANAVDLVRMYNFTTFDIMADLTFGEPLHLLDNAEYNPWIQVIFASIKRGTLMGIFFIYYPLAKRILFALLGKQIATFRREHHNYTVERVTKRLEKGRVSEGVDLWDLVLQQEDKGKAGLTRPVMDMNGELFMLAGTETTATLLSGLTYLLLTHPESMAKLVDEIRTAFNSSDGISMEVTAGLPYLNACIKEAFRHYPPVPIGLPHLTPAAGSTICGYYVPPNTNVAASHLAMYNSPDNFRLPKSFIPERWLGDPRFASDERSALQPFHVGPRDCIGKNMALHEMRLILSKVLFNIDLELLPECRNWIADQKIYSLWEKIPLMVKIKDAVVVST